MYMYTPVLHSVHYFKPSAKERLECILDFRPSNGIPSSNHCILIRYSLLAWWIAPCPLSSLGFYWALHHNRHVGTKPALRDPLSLARSRHALMKNLTPTVVSKQSSRSHSQSFSSKKKRNLGEFQCHGMRKCKSGLGHCCLVISLAQRPDGSQWQQRTESVSLLWKMTPSRISLGSRLPQSSQPCPPAGSAWLWKAHK